MSDLMKKLAKPRLFKIKGVAIKKEEGITHLDEGRMYAAIDAEEALAQAQSFWVEQMNFDLFLPGIPTVIERVGDYKIELVYDREEA